MLPKELAEKLKKEEEAVDLFPFSILRLLVLQFLADNPEVTKGHLTERLVGRTIERAYARGLIEATEFNREQGSLHAGHYYLRLSETGKARLAEWWSQGLAEFAKSISLDADDKTD